MAEKTKIYRDKENPFVIYIKRTGHFRPDRFLQLTKTGENALAEVGVRLEYKSLKEECWINNPSIHKDYDATIRGVVKELLGVDKMSDTELLKPVVLKGNLHMDSILTILPSEASDEKSAYTLQYMTENLVCKVDTYL